MFTLPIGSATRMLEQFGKQLNGSYVNGYEEGLLTLNNEFGKGRIRALNLQDELSTLIFNVRFSRQISFKLSGEESNPLFFLFCLEGHFYHSHESYPERNRVSNLQNVIVSGSSDDRTIISMPADTRLKISVIWLQRAGLENLEGSGIPRTKQKLIHILKGVDREVNYFGGLRPGTADFVRVLIENTKPGVVGRLLTEAAILNILSSQLDHYRKNRDGNLKAAPLNKKEVDTVLALAAFIVTNLDRQHTLHTLAERSGLKPKKLQDGFRYLYNCSVGHFIRDARLEHARELMETRGVNVSEAVYAVGLSSRSYFTRAFTARYGIRPSELIARSRS